MPFGVYKVIAGGSYNVSRRSKIPKRLIEIVISILHEPPTNESHAISMNKELYEINRPSLKKPASF